MFDNPKINRQRVMLESKYKIDRKSLANLEIVVKSEDKIKTLYEILLSQKYEGKVTDTTIIFLTETFKNDISTLDIIFEEAEGILPKKRYNVLDKYTQPEFNDPTMASTPVLEMIADNLFKILIAIVLSGLLSIASVYLLNNFNLLIKWFNVQKYDLTKKNLISSVVTNILALVYFGIYMTIQIRKSRKAYSDFIKKEINKIKTMDKNVIK